MRRERRKQRKTFQAKKKKKKKKMELRAQTCFPLIVLFLFYCSIQIRTVSSGKTDYLFIYILLIINSQKGKGRKTQRSILTKAAKAKLLGSFHRAQSQFYVFIRP